MLLFNLEKEILISLLLLVMEKSVRVLIKPG